MTVRQALFDRRYAVKNPAPTKRIALLWEGRCIGAHAGNSKARSSRLFRLRLRLRAKFKTIGGAV